MNDTPKISLIIPVYNVEKYLEKCLDSALSQTLDSFEVICVDDGSTDSSPEILARFAAEHGNMRVIHKENGGLSSARNAGLDAATGEYIFFLDSDDRLSGANALAGLYESATQRDLDLLIFSAELTYESEEIRKTTESPHHFRRRGAYPEVMDGRSLFCAFVENGDFRANACLLLYRRRFLESHQLRFVNGLLHEDDVFTTQCLCTAKRTFYIPEAPYARLMRAGSIMTAESQLRRARGYCLGAHILRGFYRQNLRDGGKRLKRCYFRRLWEIGERAGALWRTAPSAERGEYLRALPAEEARAMRGWLLAGVALARIRPLRRRLHRALRRAPRH